MRRNPFEDLEEMVSRFSRQLEEGMTSTEGMPVPGSIPADVVDAGEEFVVSIELPGYDNDDIDLTLSDNVLKLEANRDQKAEIENGRYIRRERTKSSASKRVRLPEPVEEEDVTAGFENGILTVRLPKVGGGDEAKQIDIE